MSEQDRLEGRTGRVWQMYARLMTQQAIADELGISQSRVSKIITEVRASIPQQTRDEIVQERVEQLRIIGRNVFLAAEEGDPQAITAFLKLQEREAKLLGLDNPTKTEVDATVRYHVAGVDTEDI